MNITKKMLFATAIAASLIIAQAIAQQKPEQHDEKPKNLKILPKNISGEQLHNIMRGYSRALGVRCGFCHKVIEVPGGKPSIDFASDAKPEKHIARKMMQMTEKINRKYLDKIGNHHFETIQCVTCHMGRTTPIVSIDSLPGKK
jgi:hypothetical protein